MPYTSFVTSGPLDSATIANGTAAATQAVDLGSKAILVEIENSSTQNLQVFFNKTSAPSGAGGYDFLVLAGKTVVLPLGELARFVSGKIYVRMEAAGTGIVCVNAIR